MRKVILAGILFVLCSAGLFASVPTGSYDYQVRECDDLYIPDILLKHTLSFDYWYDYSGDMQTCYLGELDLIAWDAGVERNGILYGDGYTMFDSVTNLHESGDWRTEVVDVPFWLCEDAGGNSRTDTRNIQLNVDTWLTDSMGYGKTGHPDDGDNMSCYYIRNVRSYDEIPDGQPVPEPGTLAMLGSGLVGLVSYEIRRRRTK